MLGKLILIMMLLCATVSAFPSGIDIWKPSSGNGTHGTYVGEVVSKTGQQLYMVFISNNQKYYEIVPVGNDYVITSTMNLTGTSDFLKSLAKAS